MQPVDTDILSSVVDTVLAAEQARIDIYSLVLVDNAGIAELNYRLLGRNRATDVISFECEAGPDGSIEAEAYISVEQAAIQAAELGHPVLWELAFLTAHAVLHSLGHDDGDEDSKQKMLDRQAEILRPMEERSRGGR